MSSSKTNPLKHEQNILVNQDYNQDIDIPQNVDEPVEINDEYYNDYNYGEKHCDDEEEEDDQYQGQVNDDNNEENDDEDNTAEEEQEEQQDEQEGQNYNKQQYRNYGMENQRINYGQYQHDENHIREQTEEDQMYDEQIIQDDRRKQHHQLTHQQEGESAENQQYLFKNSNQQETYKTNIQQKRYKQPLQFIEYKTGGDTHHQDHHQENEPQDQNQNNQQFDNHEDEEEEAESLQEDYQHNKNHYFDGQKQKQNYNKRNFEKKHQQSASGNLSSQLDSITNNSIVEDKSNIMNRIRQDESQLETSQANVSVSPNNRGEEQYEQKKQHLLDSPGNMELIKHSMYYQKYLNGESLNESYSILPVQTNQNLPSMQNSTSFGDPKGLVAALDPTLQGNELYINKMKLFESNNKLMQEMNKNRV